METNQKLGIKVFYYYLSKRITMGIVVLVFSFIISSFKGAMVAKLVFLFSLMTSISIANALVIGLYVISILLIIFGLFMSWINYISCDFTLGENAFSIRRGFLSKKEVFIPYRQVQNINIEQSFDFKIMGVSKLTIETAGSNDNNSGQAEGVFEIIDSKIALNIRESILQKTSIQTIGNI